METGPLRELLERFEAGPKVDVRPALALIAGRDLVIGEDELQGPVRRAMLLLAAGGDPHRELDLDGRAVTQLAAELDVPERRAALRAGLADLRPLAAGLPTATVALEELLEDGDLAWRSYACALLADALGCD